MFSGGPGENQFRNVAGSREVGNRRFYELLELEKEASAGDIKKAYRRLAVVHHPDKGGDPEKFKEITRAYEVLIDEDKRRLYDERGEAGIDGGAADPADIFEMFFAGGIGGRRRGKRKTKDIVHPLSITLEQLYTGCTRKLAINRDVVDNEEELRTCDACAGTGMKAEMLRLGPMMQQTQNACKSCVGTGKLHKTKKVREVLEVFVDKGAPHGHRIVFSEKGDEHVGCDPGDVIFIIHQQEHAEFKRRGADLFLAREVGLLEALTGFRMVITHLDKREFVVKTAPGEVVQPLAEGTGLKAVKGEGMPTHRNPFLFGNLFLILTIKFPDTIDPRFVPKLKEALPGPAEPEVIEDDDDVEICYLEDMDPLENTKASHLKREAYEEDREGPPGPPGCPNQ